MDARYDTDLVIENGDLATVDGADAVAQRIRDRLLTFRGEWFLDLEFGPPYREEILKKQVTMEAVSAILKTEILQVVAGEFEDFEIELDSERRLEISYTFNVAEGQIQETVTV